MAYDLNVIACYTWGNSGARGEDSVGNYDVTFRGTQTFSTTDTKGGTKWTAATNANGCTIPVALRQAIDSGPWTLECWYQVPAQAGGSDYHMDMLHSADYSGSGSTSLVGPSVTNGGGYLKYFWNVWNGTNASFSRASYPATGTWEHWSLSQSATQIKVYQNGVLKAAINTTTNYFSAVNEALAMRIGDALQNNVTHIAMHGNMDRYIVSNIDREGVETVELAPDATVRKVQGFGFPFSRFRANKLGGKA